jgi:hypothetical protein
VLHDNPTPCPFCGRDVHEDTDGGTMIAWRGLRDIDDIPGSYTGWQFHVSCLQQASVFEMRLYDADEK